MSDYENFDVKKSAGGLAYYHLPGLFEFYELYRLFLPLFYGHREYFYDWCDIGSIYGAPADCLWGGGRVGFGDCDVDDVLALMRKYGISARLTFSNSLLREEHLSDKKCNNLCRLFSRDGDIQDVIENTEVHLFEESGLDIRSDVADISLINGIIHGIEKSGMVRNGVIVHSDLLLDYLKKEYPSLYFVSSTTKVLTDIEDLDHELSRSEFEYVVPDFRLNRRFDYLQSLEATKKDKVEFLCNECCDIGCLERYKCYENVSRKNLSEECEDHICTGANGTDGYVFSKAMDNPSFIGIDDIVNTYMPMGFRNFKIEGRGLGSAMILEFLLYYMVKPSYQLKVREAVYLDSMLDLF